MAFHHGRCLCSLCWYSLRIRHWYDPSQTICNDTTDTDISCKGTISGIQEMPYWIEQFNDPAAHGKISLIVSILSVGTFVGALAAGLIADWTGRKWGIILCAAIPFNLGVILQVASTEQSMFIAGRFFAGLGVGLVSVQIPMYQAETLPKWIRGFIIGSYQLCITIGLLLASLINYGKVHHSALNLLV